MSAGLASFSLLSSPSLTYPQPLRYHYHQHDAQVIAVSGTYRPSAAGNAEAQGPHRGD